MKLFRNMTVENQTLLINQHNTSSLAKEYGTPLFVIDGDYIKEQCNTLKNHFKHDHLETEILYASKAFSAKKIYNIIDDAGLSLDVVSGGELYTAKAANFPMNRVYFHGNNKSLQEIREAINLGVKCIVVDNLMELNYMISLDESIDILLRVNPGIEAHTHEYVQTANDDSKFGISFESYDLKHAIEAIQNSKVNLLGLHCHIGSQIHETSSFMKSAQVMLDQIKLLEHKYALNLEVLNLGGGFGVYYTDEQPINDYSFLTKILDFVYNYTNEHKLNIKKVMIEPGRFLIANAGTTLYTVGFSKTTISGKSYLFVDGGMTDNIRPALYGSEYEACIANNMSQGNQNYTIAGKCCESGDILIHNATLPEAKFGDVLAIASTGAYGYSMANQYNRITKPAVVLLNEGKKELIIRRETYQDLLRLEV